MTVERAEPPYTAADERTMLMSWLNYQRATLAMKCDGLDAAQLREHAVPPSSLTLIGLVRHMADVERNWFRRVLAGEDVPSIYWSDEDPDGDFDNVDDADIDEAFATWRRECDAATKNAEATESLDVTGVHRTGAQVQLRWILIHMIEEYARHNGHADFLRERIDGVTGE